MLVFQVSIIVNPKNQNDSEDSDYEENIPLIEVKEGLKPVLGDSPIGHRTRKHLHKQVIVKCKKERHMWDLSDYENIENKNAQKAGIEPNESLRVQPTSPNGSYLNSPEMQQTSQFCEKVASANKDLNVITKMSTPKSNGEVKERYVELSPIPNSFQTTRVMPRLNQAVDICHGSFKITPQRLVHGLSGRYDWMELCNKFNQYKTFDDLQLLVQMQIDKIPNIPHIFTGDDEVETDIVDKQSMKYIPSDIPQRFLLHHPVHIHPDGNCFCRSICGNKM